MTGKDQIVWVATDGCATKPPGSVSGGAASMKKYLKALAAYVRDSTPAARQKLDEAYARLTHDG